MASGYHRYGDSSIVGGERTVVCCFGSLPCCKGSKPPAFSSYCLLTCVHFVRISFSSLQMRHLLIDLDLVTKYNRGRQNNLNDAKFLLFACTLYQGSYFKGTKRDFFQTM